MNYLSRGLWVVLATPFDDDLAVDLTSLERQLSLATSVSAQGVVALGVFGEAEALSRAEQRTIVHAVTSSYDGPVVLGMSGRTTAVVVEQAHDCLDAATRPPAALMVQVNSPLTDVVVDHLRAVHEATGLAIVVQDYPLVSNVRIATDALIDVVRRCSPFIAAVKAESAPTPPSIAKLTAEVHAPVFGGLGGVGLVDELACGAAGAMTGMSHPEALRLALDAFETGGFDAVHAAWSPWLPLANFEGQFQIGLALRKEVLRRRGLFATGLVRPPAAPLPQSLRHVLESHLAAAPATSIERSTQPTATTPTTRSPDGSRSHR